MVSPCLSFGLALVITTATAGDVRANAAPEREEDALTAVDDEYVAEAPHKAPAPTRRLAPAVEAAYRPPPVLLRSRRPAPPLPTTDRLYAFMSLRR